MNNPTTVIVMTPPELQAMIRSELKAALADMHLAAAAPADTEAFDYHSAAAFLGISESSIRRLVESGDIKPTRAGRAVRFSRVELKRFLEQGVR